MTDAELSEEVRQRAWLYLIPAWAIVVYLGYEYGLVAGGLAALVALLSARGGFVSE